MNQTQPKNTTIGWAEADLTPDGKVIIAGQFHARVSEGIEDPITASVLAIESISGTGEPGRVVFISCDLATISDALRDEVRGRVRDAIPELEPWQIIIGATHSHAAPDARPVPYGMEDQDDYIQRVKSTARKSSVPNQYGMWPDIEFGAMTVNDYVDFAAGRIAGAVARAWQQRRVGGIARGVGHAVVGRNRRLIYADGSGTMYGKADTGAFRHVEGYEDHSVHVVATYAEDQVLTGLIVNVACPAQVSEHSFLISADYWHETRQELSPADQTLLVQKSGCSGTYLPSERSVAHGGYGSVPASTDIGPEGGEMLVEWTVNALNELFN